jgi:hypothetical protein
MAVLAIVLLSAGLSQLHLLPGQPFSLRQGELERGGEYAALPGGEALLALARAIFIGALLLLPVAIVYFILSPEFRKQVLRGLISFLSFFAIAYLFSHALTDFLNVEEESTRSGGPGQAEALPPVPIAEFVAAPPRWLVPALSLVLGLLAAALLVGLAWAIWRRSRSPANVLGRLGQQAQDALDSLQAGSDMRNTVIRCYVDMARLLDERRAIRRQQNMTPREFEARLQEAGLPDEPVRRLTRLFEVVRYGVKVPGEREEREAIAALEAIVEACGSPA